MADLPLRPGRGGVGDGSPGDRGPDWTAERRPRRQPPRRSHTVAWVVVLLLLFVVGAAAFLSLRPAPAEPAFSPDTVDFGRQRLASAGDPAQITITNAGARPMRLEAVAIGGAEPADFELVSEGCTGAEQAPGESCLVEVRFTPRGVGPRRAHLELTGNLPWRAREAVLSGVGIAPRVAVDPPSVDFGPQPATVASDSILVRLSNAGTDALTVRRITVEGPAAEEFVLDERCADKSFGIDERCAFRVAFRPRAAGLRAASLHIHSDAPGETTEVPLSGVGLWDGPDFTVSPERLDFGSRRIGRAGQPLELSLTNRTAEPRAAPTVVPPRAGGGFRVAGGDCDGATVAPGRSCTFAVAFTAASEGPAEDALTLRLGTVSLTVDLAARGVAPELRLDRGSLDFGDMRAGLPSAPLALTLSNTGSDSLAVREVAVSGPDGAAFTVRRDGCANQLLGPGKQCVIELTFQPAREGRHQASLSIASDATREPEVVSLEGRGTRSFLSVRPSDLDFGEVVRGESAEREVEVSNRGTARLDIRGLRTGGTAADEYRVAGIGCRLDRGLAPGESCRLTVQFIPRVDGARPATLTVLHDGAEREREIVLHGSGSPPLPGFRVEPAGIDFGPLATGSRSGIRTITVHNPGKGFLEIRDFSLTGGGAGDFQIVPGSCQGAPRIAPGSECTVGVRFFPQSGGDKRADLVVRHNAGAGRGAVPLRGQGTP